MHWTMPLSTMSKKIHHTKDAGNLFGPISQEPAHQTKPGPNNKKRRKRLRKAGVFAKGILQDQTDRTMAARKALRDEAETCEASAACSPAGKCLPRTRPSLTLNPREGHQQQPPHA